MKTNAQNMDVPTTSRKVWSVIALGGLFVCGLMVGAAIWGTKPHLRGDMKRVGMDVAQCEEIAGRIVSAVRNGVSVERLKEYNEIYSANCNGKIVPQQPAKKEQPKTEPVEPLPEEPCAALEILLSKNLSPDDYINSSISPSDHYSQAYVYEQLAKNGCPENMEMYSKLAEYHNKIANGLNPDNFYRNKGSKPCEIIESELKHNICDGCDGVDSHLNNAVMYAKMAERGCPENSATYKQKAMDEIQIATALENPEDMNEREVRDVIETYKKLQMQDKARQIINKVQLLADPAIDFIIQMQKIIEE